MFKLKRENACYYVFYAPTRFCIVSPTLYGAMRHIMLIQSILDGNTREVVKTVRNGHRISGTTLHQLYRGITPTKSHDR